MSNEWEKLMETVSPLFEASTYERYKNSPNPGDQKIAQLAMNLAHDLIKLPGVMSAVGDPDKLLDATIDVCEWHKDAEEIGTSDWAAYKAEALNNLGLDPGDHGMPAFSNKRESVQEASTCQSCLGDGMDGYGHVCSACDGTGEGAPGNSYAPPKKKSKVKEESDEPIAELQDVYNSAEQAVQFLVRQYDLHRFEAADTVIRGLTAYLKQRHP